MICTIIEKIPPLVKARRQKSNKKLQNPGIPLGFQKFFPQPGDKVFSWWYNRSENFPNLSKWRNDYDSYLQGS